MATTYYDLRIDGVSMPTPAKEGIIEADQLIWSSNAGRVASGKFVGDIIAEKKTLTINWNTMTYLDYKRIKEAISRVGKPFITVSYWACDSTQASERKSFRGYTEGLTGTIVTYTGLGKVINVSLNFVEQ